MTASETEKARVLHVTEERGEFLQLEDGYFYFLPRKSVGALAAHHLKWIADELDEKNQDWNNRITRDL